MSSKMEQWILLSFLTCHSKGGICGDGGLGGFEVIHPFESKTAV